jgi:hypothetical protein
MQKRSHVCNGPRATTVICIDYLFYYLIDDPTGSVISRPVNVLNSAVLPPRLSLRCGKLAKVWSRDRRLTPERGFGTVCRESFAGTFWRCSSLGDFKSP